MDCPTLRLTIVSFWLRPRDVNKALGHFGDQLGGGDTGFLCFRSRNFAIEATSAQRAGIYSGELVTHTGQIC